MTLIDKIIWLCVGMAFGAILLFISDLVNKYI